jgi:hypothetical protein
MLEDTLLIAPQAEFRILTLQRQATSPSSQTIGYSRLDAFIQTSQPLLLYYNITLSIHSEHQGLGSVLGDLAADVGGDRVGYALD